MIGFSRRVVIAGICAATTVGTAVADTINVKVSGLVPILQQPSPNTCWATAATIMYSWKTNQSRDIGDVVRIAGSQYGAMFDSDQALSGSDKPNFLQGLGLHAEPPQTYLARGWAALLAAGPVWVTTNEGGIGNFSAHARVMTAIFGDGTFDGTSAVLVDPGTGTSYTESLTDFTNKFEDVARADLGAGGDLRPQAVRF